MILKKILKQNFEWDNLFFIILSNKVKIHLWLCLSVCLSTCERSHFLTHSNTEKLMYMLVKSTTVRFQLKTAYIVPVHRWIFDKKNADKINFGLIYVLSIWVKIRKMCNPQHLFNISLKIISEIRVILVMDEINSFCLLLIVIFFLFQFTRKLKNCCFGFLNINSRVKIFAFKTPEKKDNEKIEHHSQIHCLS